MKSAKPGKSTLAVEVTNVSSKGFWLFVDEVEHFVPFEQFGVNALIAYVVSRLDANPLKAHVMGRSIYDNLLEPLATPANASLLFALVNVLAVFVIIFTMYRRRIFVKL